MYITLVKAASWFLRRSVRASLEITPLSLWCFLYQLLPTVDESVGKFNIKG